MVRLPSEYQEVEYLESTGKQWIDTGILPDNTTEVRTRIQKTVATQDISVFGTVRTGAYSSAYTSMPRWYHLTPYNNKWYMGTYDAERSGGSYADSVGTFYDVIFNDSDHNVVINEDVVLSAEPTFGTIADATLAISARGQVNAQGVSRYGRWKYFYFEIRNNQTDEILRNFIPCYRKSDSEPGMYDTVTKTFYTNSGTGEFLVGNDVTYDPINLLETRRKILLNTPHLDSASGQIATFQTDMSAPLKECKISFLPVQEGSGDPSPDNVRPITGWDGVTVTRCGRNIISEDFLRDYTNYKNIGSYGYSYTDWIYLAPNTQYVYSWSNYNDDALDTCQLYIQNASKYPIRDGNYAKSNFVFTTNAEGSVRFGINKGNYSTHQDALTAIFANGRFQIELGSTPTDYEPYTAQELTIPFPQTIYGGYVDLVKGEVVEEWYGFVVDGVNYYPVTSRYLNDEGCAVAYNIIGDGGFSGLSYGDSDKALQVKADRMPNINGSWRTLNKDCIQCGKARDHLYIRVAILSSELDDVSSSDAIETSMRTWLQNNPVQISYPLETPIHHQLSPQTIKTLKGVNNIWSNANGDISVRFWKH